MLTSVAIFFRDHNDAERTAQIQIILTLCGAIIAVKLYGRFAPFVSDTDDILSEIGQWNIVISLTSMLFISLQGEGEASVAQLIFFGANFFVLSFSMYTAFRDVEEERALMNAISKKHLTNLKNFADLVNFTKITKAKTGPVHEMHRTSVWTKVGLTELSHTPRLADLREIRRLELLSSFHHRRNKPEPPAHIDHAPHLRPKQGYTLYDSGKRSSEL